MDNATLLGRLFASGGIDLRRGELFDQSPAPLPTTFDWDRVDGMLLGLAIGDALGNTTESLLPERRRELLRRDPRLRAAQAAARTLATPTDDTQLAFWTLDQLLVDDGLVPEHGCQALRLGAHLRHRAAPSSQAMSDLRSGDRPWYECGAPSAGNGALMRIAPMLVPFVRSPSTDLWADTALSAIVTHNDAASTSACLAFVAMLWQLLGMDDAAGAVVVAAPLRRARRATSKARPGYAPRGGAFVGVRRAALAVRRRAAGRRRGRGPQRRARPASSGAPAPTCSRRCPACSTSSRGTPRDPEEALVRAVNDTKDNDTIAAIVGAAVGRAARRRGTAGALGRAAPAAARAPYDDGEVQRIMARARTRWDSTTLENSRVT